MIFWRLILAHLLIDFTFQTNFIAEWKRRNVWGALLHSMMFLVVGTILCWGYLTDIWVMAGNNMVIIQGWMALVLLTIFHFMEDEWRVWTIQKLNSPDTMFFFIWDQVIHIVFIFVLFPQSFGIHPEPWVLLAILFVLTTHFTTIFIYYLEKDVFGQTNVLVHDKYFSMIERLITALALLLPGWWALSFLFVWIARAVISSFWRRPQGFTWTNIIVGNSMAALFGFLARLVYYA
ncbi:MAG: DUF3307 domain-containing protein [Elusimicrobiota bacterium]